MHDARRFLLALACFPVLASCGSSPPKANDPVLVLGDRARPPQARIKAAQEAVQRAGEEPVLLSVVGNALADVAWSGTDEPPVRHEALARLIEHPSPSVRKTLRERIAQSLGHENDPTILAACARLVQEERWQECENAMILALARPHLVRSDRWSTPGPSWQTQQVIIGTLGGRAPTRGALPLATTQEAQSALDDALTSLAGDAGTSGAARRAMTLAETSESERLRLAAFHVAQRLEPGIGASSGPIADALSRASAAGVPLPTMGEELAWLLAMTRDARADAWAAMQSDLASLPLEVRASLRMGDVPIVRWARANRPDWVSLPASERAARVLGSVIGNARIRESLLQQLDRDEADRQASWGGWLEGERAVLTPPRMAERAGDVMFVPTDALLADSVDAIAWYRFRLAESGGLTLPRDRWIAQSTGRYLVVFGERLGATLVSPDGDVRAIPVDAR